MSIGLVNVPFFSMINFSNTCGIGLNGARSMKIAAMIRIEYGILSRIVHIGFPWSFENKNCANLSRKSLFVKKIDGYRS